MIAIKSQQTARIPIPTDRVDEEFGEGMVRMFIAKANRMRRTQGLSDLNVGALASPGLPGMIRIEAELPS
ncbi:MAG: hypothetical protein ABR905_13295 [Terracidiphilus sp.]|jgi:hypothetical protein